MVVKPLEQLDRVHNPKDIEPDEAAMRNGFEHGGTIESRAEALSARGSGGRKRSPHFAGYRNSRNRTKQG